MTVWIVSFLGALLLILGQFALAADKLDQAVVVGSPNGNVEIAIRLAPEVEPGSGGPIYHVNYRGKPVVHDSSLGLTFLNGGPLSRLEVAEVRRDSRDTTYPVVAGKSATARDHYNEATIVLQERPGGGRRVEVVLRAYDDGAAFRYRFPEQPGLKEFAITSEDSGFNLPTGATAWVLPVPKYTSHYEFYYQPTKVAELEAGKLIGLPLLLVLPDGGPAVAITEANLTDYAGMYLVPAPAAPALSTQRSAESRMLRTSLAPLPEQDKVPEARRVRVKGKTPHQSPWRVIMLGDTPGGLIASNLVLNLSDPCAIADTSWIRPGKIAFLWWNGYLVDHNGRRGGVNTATYKHYVNAAADLGFEYSSIDGLDHAWYGGKIPGYGEHDITVPVPELNMQEVLAHAKSKGVRIRLWVASQGLRKHLDKALETYARWGVEGIMVDFIERDDQEAVNWVREVVEKAAKHKLTVTLHNCPKPTGLRRTYPNLLTHEAVLNQEWNKWSTGSTPDHELTVPFTRMLAGPLDFHSGGFRSVRPQDFAPRDVAPEVMGTRCHQLAMYVAYENPMPMAVDYPAAYRNRPGIEFLSSVPTTWDETRVIHGKVGDYITVARRKGTDWYVGSMTDGTARDLKIPLRFLGKGQWVAEEWADDPVAGPNAVARRKSTVTAADTLIAAMAPAGGHAVRLTPAGQAER